MRVYADTDLRIGRRSSAQITRANRCEKYTLDRLGTDSIGGILSVSYEEWKKRERERRAMIDKYGRTKYSVEAAGLEHESTISSPSPVLAALRFAIDKTN